MDFKNMFILQGCKTKGEFNGNRGNGLDPPGL